MSPAERPSAAIVTVGTELTLGLNVDTNSAEIASALTAAGFRVAELVSVPDDRDAASAHLRRLCGLHALVVATGGLGPTHDDLTREAASDALSLPLRTDPMLVELLRHVAERHTDDEAREQVFRQADVLSGASVVLPDAGTAPGQIVPTAAGRLVLLPGPPAEMRVMLDQVLAAERGSASPPVLLGVSGMSESDTQVAAQRALEGAAGVGLTVLATPGDVRVVLVDEGAGEEGLDAAAHAVTSALGDACYGRRTLAETVMDAARDAGVRIATAESCTGGMVSAALTDVPGASDVFLGGVIAYGNTAKAGMLGVPEGMLAQFGAVSEQVAKAMAEGALERFGAGLAVAVTGVAGPGGGTEDKPVGLVWFGIADSAGSEGLSRTFPGDRDRVRRRASLFALDLLRRTLEGA